MNRRKTWGGSNTVTREAERKAADWSPLYSDSTGWYRWYNGEGWVHVTGPEEGAPRAAA